jgi:hypothetical protein
LKIVYWWFRGYEREESPTQLVEDQYIHHIYQKSVQETWYYEYAHYMVVNDNPRLTRGPENVVFTETTTYEWKDTLTAEELARLNQEEIAKLGPPPNARIVSRESSVDGSPYVVRALLENEERFIKQKVNQHLYGDFYFNPTQALKLFTKSGLKKALSTGMDFVPILGNIKSVVEFTMGIDPITGEKLSRIDRTLAGAGIVTGGWGKSLGKGTKAAFGLVSDTGKASSAAKFDKLNDKDTGELLRLDLQFFGDKSKSIVSRNKAKGDAYELEEFNKMNQTHDDVRQQITVKTKSGVKTRIDIIGKNKETGQIECVECKSSSTAPLTKNQKKAFPEIEESGAIVIGKGKPPYTGGTQIPPTKVEVRRKN